MPMGGRRPTCVLVSRACERACDTERDPDASGEDSEARGKCMGCVPAVMAQ